MSKLICGVDEAGRGPLAGPVCAAAVILPDDCIIEGLNDSKKLSEKKREQLYDVIVDKAVSFAVAFGTVEEIEEHNILQATFIAMNRAIELLDPIADYALIDGNQNKLIKIPSEAIVHGDALIPSISAASILAKVTRDHYMLDMDAVYPGYGFSKHKGYGTKAHYDAIKELGPSPIHRLSFLKKVL